MSVRNKTTCPFGHDNIDYVDMWYYDYVFCYTCGRMFFEEDYEEILRLRLQGYNNEEIKRVLEKRKQEFIEKISKGDNP